MNTPPFDLFLLFIYFLYGLAFFTLGMTLSVEGGRYPALVNARILRPLALFGLLHGVHEWIDAYLLQSESLQVTLPAWLPWFRWTILSVSFLFLLLFDIRTFRSSQYKFQPIDKAITAFMGIYLVVILASAIKAIFTGTAPLLNLLNALSRYLLAVPAASLAGLALKIQALNTTGKERQHLITHLSLAAAGFAIYGLTQVFVSRVDMFPATYVNSAAFKDWFGFPIQLVRTATAVLITLGMLRSTQLAERERQRQIHDAEKEYMQAMLEREHYRHELLIHTVRAQEDERSRIARELHDETSQTLTAFSLNLATLRKKVSRDKDIVPMVDQLQGLCKQTSQSLYRLVHDLRPAELDDLGLIPAIQYLRDYCYQQGMDVSIEVDCPYRRLDATVETVLFRVVQEALNNVVRHAHTNKAQVKVEFCEGEIRIKISDNGVGFDPEKPLVPPHGWGLAGMRERVDLIGGKLKITSKAGSGTTVEVIVPDEYSLIFS